MVCLLNCSIAVIFLVAMLYLSFSVDKSLISINFTKMLNKQQTKYYEHIIRERRNIYLSGYILGIFLSFLFIMFMKTQKYKLTTNQMICSSASITFLTVYFYYILSKKPNLMVIYLDKKEQRIEWAKIYRTMQYNYHFGLVLGILAVILFTNGTC